MALDLINLGTPGVPNSGEGGHEGGIKINAMFTELYNITDALDTTYLPLTGGTLTGGLSVEGSTDAVIINAEDSIEDPGGGNGTVAMKLQVTSTGSPFATIGALALDMTAITESTPTFPGSAVVGLRAVAINSSVSYGHDIIGALLGCESTAGSQASTNAYGLLIKAAGYSVKPVSSYGAYISNQGMSGITDSFGLYMAKTSGATNDYGIVLAGDDAGADIVFGGGQDASIYYDGTDLAIDTALVGSGTLDLVSQSASAITTETLQEYVTIKIGGVSKKIAIVA